MINQFKSGNHAYWDKLVTSVTQINNEINNNLIPAIENVLTSMLGAKAEFEKESIDISEEISNNHLSGITCRISYSVPDFLVEDAPQEAITTDETAIKDALAGFHVIDVNIDVKKGLLTASSKFSFIG